MVVESPENARIATYLVGQRITFVDRGRPASGRVRMRVGIGLPLVTWGEEVTADSPAQ